MNKVPVRCQAFSIHYLFESSLQVGKIYILPSFLPNDKTEFQGV